MLLFGLTTFSCFFIYTEILRLKKNFFTFNNFNFFEIFFSYSSMLSRALIMNLSVITFSFTKYLNLIRNKKFFFNYYNFDYINVFNKQLFFKLCKNKLC